MTPTDKMIELMALEIEAAAAADIAATRALADAEAHHTEVVARTLAAELRNRTNVLNTPDAEAATARHRSAVAAVELTKQRLVAALIAGERICARFP